MNRLQGIEALRNDSFGSLEGAATGVAVGPIPHCCRFTRHALGNYPLSCLERQSLEGVFSQTVGQ